MSAAKKAALPATSKSPRRQQADGDRDERISGHSRTTGRGEPGSAEPRTQQTEAEETRTVGGGWGRTLAGLCVEATIRHLVSSGAESEVDVWALQQAATFVVRDQHGMQRSQAWIRRSVAAYVGVYLWRFLPPPDGWKLVDRSSDDDSDATSATDQPSHSADLVWLSRGDGLVLVDEVKVASGLAYVRETSSVRKQLDRHLQRAGLDYATTFRGVRFIPLGLPRRAMLLTPDGSTRLADTPYCTEGGWR